MRLSEITLPSKRSYWLIAAAAIAIHVAISIYRLRDSYFLLDDFMFLGGAHKYPLGIPYLTWNLYGHVEPLSLLTQWVFIHSVGWNYAAAETILIAISSVAVALISLVAYRSRLNLAMTILSTATAAVSWTTIEPLRWWSCGVQVMFSTVFVLIAIWVCAKPSANLKLSERVFLGAALVAAGAFYNKAIFSIVLCSAIRLFAVSCAPPDYTRKSLGQSVRLALADMTASIMGVSAFLAFVVAVNLRSPAQSATVSIANLVSGVAVGAQYGWLPGATGLRIDQHASFLIQIYSAVLIDLICGIVLLNSFTKNIRSSIVWGGLALTIAVELALIATIRVPTFGLTVMSIGRYHTDGVFMTLAASAVAFGRAFTPGPAPILANCLPKSRNISFVGAACVGAIVLIFQISGGIRYPQIWDTRANRGIVENIDRGDPEKLSRYTVGERILPEAIIDRWRAPWNYLSNLGPMLPRPLRVASWDIATQYMDDEGNLHDLANAPRQRLEDVDGTALVLSVVPPFQYVGFFERVPPDHVSGWLSPLLASPGKVRVAVVSHRRIVAWATDRQTRADVGAFFNGSREMADSGFIVALPRSPKIDDLSALAIIDNRIGIELPLLVNLDNSHWVIQAATTTPVTGRR